MTPPPEIINCGLTLLISLGAGLVVCLLIGIGDQKGYDLRTNIITFSNLARPYGKQNGKKNFVKRYIEKKIIFRNKC